LVRASAEAGSAVLRAYDKRVKKTKQMLEVADMMRALSAAHFSRKHHCVKIGSPKHFSRVSDQTLNKI
jgi:hypothetical protein